MALYCPGSPLEATVPMHRAVAGTCLLQALLIAPAPPAAGETATITEGTNFALTAGPEGAVVIDVQGALWKLRPGTAPAIALTDGLGDDRLPRFSPDGQHLVFQSFRRGDFNIWRLPASGGEPQPLTSGPADDREPAWYPDGRRIAFTSDRSGNLDIWQLDLATGAVTALTTDPADDYWPAISADGERLAFVSDRAGPAGLYVQALDPNPVKVDPVAGGKAGPAAAPAFSPDGRELAYIRTTERIGFPSIARHEVAVVDLASGELRTVSTPTEDVFPFPRPSPLTARSPGRPTAASGASMPTADEAARHFHCGFRYGRGTTARSATVLPHRRNRSSE